MFPQFRYLDGARAGEIKAVGSDFATLGRHPTSDLTFEADAIEVSVRHAAVFKQGGGYLVRDLGSTNGTFVNDQRVRGDRPLEPKDVIRLGPSGPRVEFSTTATMPIGSKARAITPPLAPVPSTEIYRPRERTTAQFPANAGAVAAKRRRWPWVVAGATIVGLAGVAVLVSRLREARGLQERQRAALVARLDDQLARLAGASTSIPALASALATDRAEATSIRTAALSPSSDREVLDSLDRARSALAGRSEPRVRAAAFEPGAASQPGGSAVAVIIGEVSSGGGATRSATGVVVRASGDSVWIVVPRAVVIGPDDRPATRIAVIFRGAKVAHLGTMVEESDSLGLALIKASGRISAPPAVGLVDSAAAGDPVAAVGFPAGADSLGDWRKSGALATTVVGTILSAAPATLAIDGYGSAAPVGSPLFTASGKVVGLVVANDGGRWRAVVARAIGQLLLRVQGTG